MLLDLAQKSTQLKDLCKTSVKLSNSKNEPERDGKTSINIQAIKDKLTKKPVRKILNVTLASGNLLGSRSTL
ncbi:hypothetical protein RIR_jg22372.t1 [Rhizophagus irregularis DAOM 181602=DAOM 197198]|nr:hypothetical protein RIR_jg22372.t1 [Rhizophagus irregularis DAOM 181602=DAOM 197198]